MGEQTRETLRQYFRAGQLPTEAHFGDLVDSMLNMKDEGFRKSPQAGLEISAAAGQDVLESWYRDADPTHALWQLRFGAAGDRLQFDRSGTGPAGALPPVLSLDMAQRPATDGQPERLEPRVGVGTATPAHTLDVAGVLAAQGRRGSLPLASPSLRADGRPQALLTGLTGCQAFELVAGVGGGRGSGRFALLHAVVLNAYHPRRPWWRRLWPGQPGIRITSAHYGRRCDRLLLDWTGDKHGKDAEYGLAIRSGCDYGDGVMIQVGITRLWFDPLMDGSVPDKR